VKALLSSANRAVLARLAASRGLLAFDFDGTLAPIVVRRDAAVMRPGTARLFGRLCELYPCAVISGRSRSDVAARLGGAPVRYVVGNHGLEPGATLRACRQEMGRVRSLLELALLPEPGVELEDKRYSLAIHYRMSPRRRGARSMILAAIASLPVPVRAVGGKSVVNLVPAWAPHKGNAFLRLVELEAAATALYVGDDVTDEDVFQLDHGVRLITARVGASRRSSAAYTLRDQGAIDLLLETLLELRLRGGGP
jgi:trehalose 6-phosphate phosphatase